MDGGAGPDVTVVVCTRNRARRLATALVSVQASIAHAQAGGLACELVVVDNGSSDGTAEELARIARRDAYVVPVHEPVAGLGRARAAGVAAARGAVVLFTDDDVVVPDAWVTAMARPLLDDAADVVTSGVRMAAELERSWMTPDLRSKYYAHVPVPPRTNPGLVGASMGARAEVLRRIGFDDSLGTAEFPGAEDVLLYVQALEAGYRVVGVQDVVVEHRFDPDRLDADRLLRQAAGYGRCDAYYFHHWLHAELRAQRLRWLVHASRREVARVAARSRHDERYVQLVRDAAFHREMLRLRGTPRRYAPRGVGVLA